MAVETKDMGVVDVQGLDGLDPVLRNASLLQGLEWRAFRKIDLPRDWRTATPKVVGARISAWATL